MTETEQKLEHLDDRIQEARHLLHRGRKRYAKAKEAGFEELVCVSRLSQAIDEALVVLEAPIKDARRGADSNVEPLTRLCDSCGLKTPITDLQITTLSKKYGACSKCRRPCYEMFGELD